MYNNKKSKEQKLLVNCILVIQCVMYHKPKKFLMTGVGSPYLDRRRAEGYQSTKSAWIFLILSAARKDIIGLAYKRQSKKNIYIYCKKRIKN